MNEWQTIESAPKDGTSVLVWPPLWNGKSCSMASYDDDRYSTKPRPFWRRDDDIGQRSRSREAPPTLWQPLPAPPTA